MPAKNGIDFIAVRWGSCHGALVVPFLLETTRSLGVEKLAQNLSEALHVHHVHFFISLSGVSGMRQFYDMNVI
jgi:hypothetical protein